MRKYLLHVLIISVVFLSIPIAHAIEERGINIIPVSPTGHQVRGNQWLFVIGINTYLEWSRLNTAVNDAQTVRDVLLKRYHFDKHHLIELYDEDATRSNILAKLRYLAKRVGPDDSIVIFYAGHGHMDSITKSGSWIPVESSVNDTSAWVSNHDIKNYLRVDAIKAKHILLISDSCFSGDFFRGKRDRLPVVTEEVIKRAYERSSRQAITSGGLEPVVDAGFSGNSVFTHFMVQALEENEKPFLIPSDFFPDIKAGVAENAEQFPLFGTLKDTGGQEGGELVFFLKQNINDVADKVEDRQAELKRLKELERQSKVAREKEQAEIARKEEELTKLDTRIKEMKERLGTKAVDTDDSLDTMLAMVRNKKQQAERLKELRRKRESEEKKRLAEIDKLKVEQAKNRREAIKEDIRKYEEIVSSEYGRDMQDVAWDNLVRRHPGASGLATGDINGLKRKLYPKIVIRSSYRELSVSQVQSMPNMSIRSKESWGFYGHSTINHDYDLKSINGDKVVIDHATGLMWHQNGSDKYMKWNKAKDWVRSLNSRGYAGYHDWRLPTVEEAASLLESSKSNGRYTDPVFSKKQKWIWTGDKVNGSEAAWGVLFTNGYVHWCPVYNGYYARPVRSLNREPKSAIQKPPEQEQAEEQKPKIPEAKLLQKLDQLLKFLKDSKGDQHTQKDNLPISIPEDKLSILSTFNVFSGLAFSEKKDGLKIVEVESGSPGFDAGLMTGDMVLEIEGKKTKKLEDYVEISREVKNKKVEVSLVILRNGVSYDVTIMIYSVPIYQHWKEKVTKPIELPRGLTNTPYEYWNGKGFRVLTKPNDKLSLEAKTANYNLALRHLFNALHYRPESIDTALKVAKSYHELGKLHVMNGDINKGIINYGKSVKFYASCHKKTQREDLLSEIRRNFEDIESELSKIDTGESN